MNRVVIKRDGRRENFDAYKILNAVCKAYLSCHKTIDIKHLENWLYEYLNHYIGSLEEVHVETIQDVVEKMLMQYDPEVAKPYILYRENHKDLRYIKERIEYMDSYAESKENAATTSETDANANVQKKNVANLDGEVYKTLNRQIQRYRMKKKLQQMYPGYADQYLQDLDNHIIYVHDEASSPAVKNYCQAVTLYPLLVDGTGGMDGLNTTPPKNLNSFCGQLVNLLFLLSSQCKGAVAFGEFFNFLDYFCVKDFGENYDFEADTVASIKPKRTVRDTIHQAYQQIVYGWNQPAGNRSYQSPFSNISYYDSNYWHALFDEFQFPDGTKPLWRRVDWLQRDFMQWFNKERTKTLLTFPVETMALLSDGYDILDQDYKMLAARMYAEGHSFFTYISDNPNALASCCRLSNKILENVFSFTNGLTGVQTGSANVITLNLNRIVQDYMKREFPEWKPCDKTDDYTQIYEGFRKYLENILDRVYKYHKTYKTLLYETEEKGMLDASTAGYIKMSKLYSTIGINGLNEAAEFLGHKCNYNEGYKEFCNLITTTISECNKKNSTKEFMFNTELVPAEGLSSKNYKWDKLDGYWVPSDRNLYNSYFYLASDPETSVLDRFRLHGAEFTRNLDGGVGLHCNLEEHLSYKQYMDLITFAVKQGTSYFTFNIPNSECVNKDCGFIVKAPLDKCPKCGSRMRQWTRVIGFLRPVEGFDKERYKEALTRVYSKKDEV